MLLDKLQALWRTAPLFGAAGISDQSKVFASTSQQSTRLPAHGYVELAVVIVSPVKPERTTREHVANRMRLLKEGTPVAILERQRRSRGNLMVQLVSSARRRVRRPCSPLLKNKIQTGLFVFLDTGVYGSIKRESIL